MASEPELDADGSQMIFEISVVGTWTLQRLMTPF